MIICKLLNKSWIKILGVCFWIYAINSYGYQNVASNYIRINAGYSHPAGRHSAEHENNTTGAPMVSIGVGCIINPKLRADITATYVGKYRYRYEGNNIKEQQDVDSKLLMLNIYWHFKDLYGRRIKCCNSFFPYLMGGVGHASNATHNNRIGNKTIQATLLGVKKDSIAWQVGIGTLFNISKKIDIDFLYKYVYLGKTFSHRIREEDVVQNLAFVPKIKNLLKAHEFSIALHFKFNSVRR